MRTIGSLLICALPGLVVAQCTGGDHIYHPFGSCTAGYIALACPDEIDSVVWSNGQVGFEAHLTPGVYAWQAYANGEVVQSSSGIEIVQLAWSISDVQNYWMDNTGFTISGWAEVPWCGTSAWNAPCCSPESELTYMRLVQDGTTEITTGPCAGCDSMPCHGSTFRFGGVPTGHSYTVRLYDLGCGNMVDDTTQIIAHACDSLKLVVETTGTPPGNLQGAIVLVEAQPDTTEPYPLQAPVSGVAALYRGLEGWDMVGTMINGSSATWAGLDTGYYRVVFTPDAACNRITETVHISVPVGLEDPTHSPKVAISQTDDPGKIMVRVENGVPVQVRMFSALGQEVAIRKLGGGLYDIGALPMGMYVVKFHVGSAIHSCKFVRH